MNRCILLPLNMNRACGALISKMSWKWCGVSSGPCFKETFSFHFLETQLLIPCCQENPNYPATKWDHLSWRMNHQGRSHYVKESWRAKATRHHPVPKCMREIFDCLETCISQMSETACVIPGTPGSTEEPHNQLTESRKWHSCCFKLLSFGDICYVKFENQNCLFFSFFFKIFN